jgi:hypothetical protein
MGMGEGKGEGGRRVGEGKGEGVEHERVTSLELT